jgi:4'-phosphopantetheinyl transferase
MLALEPHHIDLWVTYQDEMVQPDLLQRYSQLLTPAERQAQARFHFAKDQHRYLLTRALVRTVLSHYAPTAPQDWTFDVNAWGKPFVTHTNTLTEHIAFNVSHTDGLIVLAVGQHRALGVDVEQLSRNAPLDAAHAYFSAAESASLAQLPAEQQAFRFFQYWTLKESYIKARGMGLSIPLDQFSFNLEAPSHIRLSTDPRLQDAAVRWQFWQFRLPSDHLVALCAERLSAPGAPATTYAVRKTIPLGPHYGQEWALLAQSAAP